MVKIIDVNATLGDFSKTVQCHNERTFASTNLFYHTNLLVSLNGETNALKQSDQGDMAS